MYLLQVHVPRIYILLIRVILFVNKNHYSFLLLPSGVSNCGTVYLDGLISYQECRQHWTIGPWSPDRSLGQLV